MSKTKVTLRTGSTEDFFNRLLDRARKLDRGETLPPGITISFEDPEDLLEVLPRRGCGSCDGSSRNRNRSLPWQHD